MPRIKKKGLDYFPLDTSFMRDRRVRCVCRNEGDAAGYVLLGLLTSIYGGEGYYVKVDDMFYKELNEEFFRVNIDALKRVVKEALDAEIFDRTMYDNYSILTSAEIQEQYLFSTKRRGMVLMDPRFVLLSEQQIAGILPTKRVQKTAGNAPKTVKNVPESTKNSEKRTSGTQSTAQHSIAQHRKENSSLLRSSECAHTGAHTGGEEGGDFASPVRETGPLPPTDCHPADPAAPPSPPGQPPVSSESPAKPSATPPRKELTEADLERMQPPADGQRRNFPGLLENLRQCQVPISERRVIILRSNFGVIGHPVWKGFCTLRDTYGKIRMPGRYLLSLCSG